MFLFDQAICALRVTQGVREGVRRCHSPLARRVLAKGDRGDGGGAIQTQMPVAGEARASAAGTGSGGGTCNGHIRSGGRLLPFMRRLPVRVDQLSSRAILRSGIAGPRENVK